MLRSTGCPQTAPERRPTTCSTTVGGRAGGRRAGLGAGGLLTHACALGFNPRWGQTLQFQLRAPELVLVRFVVEDYDTTSPNDFVGQFTLPLSSLKQGWRGRRGLRVWASKTLFAWALHVLRELA